MHLGQTASFLASVLNRPEPKTKMVARLLREGGHVRKGGRGPSAPHTNSQELASFLIAIMASPDSPSTGLERLPHFATLPLDPDVGKDMAFLDALALLLDRLSGETWEKVQAKHWHVTLDVGYSRAEILETFQTNEGPDEKAHTFAAFFRTPDDEPVISNMPYFGGLDFASSVGCSTLFRIAKVVLAGEDDPWPKIADALISETEEATA